MRTSRRPTGSAGPSRSAHSTRDDALELALVEQPAREGVGRVVEPVQVEVEQGQAAGVLGHQHERRRAHDVA